MNIRALYDMRYVIKADVVFCMNLYELYLFDEERCLARCSVSASASDAQRSIFSAQLRRATDSRAQRGSDSLIHRCRLLYKVLDLLGVVDVVDAGLNISFFVQSE